jgi:hypothetical protein
MYRLHLQGRKIFKIGTSVSRWLQTELAVENTQLYKDGKSTERRGEGSVEKQVAGQSRSRIVLVGHEGGVAHVQLESHLTGVIHGFVGSC